MPEIAQQMGVAVQDLLFVVDLGDKEGRSRIIWCPSLATPPLKQELPSGVTQHSREAVIDGEGSNCHTSRSGAVAMAG